jgi:membrane-associated phospholipid phosphatase
MTPEIAINVAAEEGQTAPHSTWHTRPLNWAIASILFILAAWFIAAIDEECSQWLRALALPGDLRKAVDLSEVFAHGLGATAIMSTVFLLAREQRKAIGVGILMVASSGLLANGLKACFVRIRPHSQTLIQVVDFQNATSGLGGGENQPAAVGPSFWDSRQRSFPSGHAAVAWGLVAALTLVYPRGWLLFVAFAVLASLQRVTSGAHFPSDVLAGGAVALAVASLTLYTHPLLRGHGTRERAMRESRILSVLSLQRDERVGPTSAYGE